MGFENLRIPDSSWLLNARVKSPAEAILGGFQDASKMRDLFNTEKVNKLTLDDAQRKADAGDALDQLTKQFPMTAQGQMGVASGLAQKGFGPEALNQQKIAEDWQQKTKDVREKNLASMHERASHAAGIVLGMPPGPQRDAYWQHFKTDMKTDGYEVSDIPDQVPDDQTLTMLYKSSMSAKESGAQDQNKNELTETTRHNKAMEEIQRNKPAPNGYQWVQSGDNWVLVGKTPQTAGAPPVAGPPVKTPQLPGNIGNAITENTVNISKANEGVAAIKEYANATGWLKGKMSSTDLGSTVLNAADPKGIKARAAITDLGSMILHDRSGAAVTASEYPRLKPFIPQATDSYETLMYKLPRFIKIFQQENDELYRLYPQANRSTGASGSWSPDPGPITPPGERAWKRVEPTKK